MRFLPLGGRLIFLPFLLGRMIRPIGPIPQTQEAEKNGK